jgi:hypothetical protein
MPAQGYRIHDPFKADLNDPSFIESTSAYERLCLDLIFRVHERNEKIGRKGQDCFIICAIHRQKGIHNYFNLAMNIPQLTSRGIRCSEYGGALGHAEQLLEGDWRIATPDEEKTCREKDEEARRAKVERMTRDKTLGMAALGQEIARAVRSTK